MAIGDQKKSFRRVMRSEELPAAVPGDRPVIREIEVSGWQMLIARRPGGDVVAFQTNCPHQGTPLKHASFWGEYLQCPQHRYIYDPATGQNVLPARKAPPDLIWRLKPGSMRTYDVEEKDGWIWVAEMPNAKPAEYGPDNPPPPLELPRMPPSQRGAPPPIESGPLRHAGEDLTIKLGEEVELVLPTQALPGHFWQLDPPCALVTLAGQSFEPGDRAVYKIRLRATAGGRATLTCCYARPFGSLGPSEIRTYNLTVEQ